jgi:hypothetical protein
MIKIGIIAEDNSDVEVIKVLLAKFKKTSTFSVRSFVGNGCGKIRNKCGVWAQQLHLRGCHALLVVHDLDRRSSRDLRESLSAALISCPIGKRAIIIPVEEIEAWLFTDAHAIRHAFSLKKLPKVPANPESVASPKEKLQALIWRDSGKTKRYINTVHNEVIAKHSSIPSLRKCLAFRLFERFVVESLI